MGKVDDNFVSRSVSIQVWVDKTNKDLYKSVIASLRHYRGVARHIYALLFEAQAAGADLEMKDDNFRLKPNNERAKNILALAMDKKKDTGELYKAPVYEVRDYVFGTLSPTWRPFVFDSMRMQVWACWNAPDTEFPKAKRGFMSLQGARGVARFQRVGIGFPRATAKPRLEGHSVFLNWDKEIGEVEFKFEKLDYQRYWIWKQVRDGVWDGGTVFLTENDGDIRIVITYKQPKVKSDVDPERVLKVSFSDQPDSFIRMQGPGGETAYDSISALGATAGIDELFKRTEYYQKRMGAAGNKRKPWGFRKGFVDVSKTLSRITERRELQSKDWNHRWTRRVIENMKRWRCGKVEIVDRPTEKLLNRPWGWHQFETFLKYKIDEIGGKLISGSPTDPNGKTMTPVSG